MSFKCVGFVIGRQMVAFPKRISGSIFRIRVSIIMLIQMPFETAPGNLDLQKLTIHYLVVVVRGLKISTAL